MQLCTIVDDDDGDNDGDADADADDKVACILYIVWTPKLCINEILM